MFAAHLFHFTTKKGRQTKRSFALFSRGDHVGAHLICGDPCAAIKFKIQGRVNEPASRRNRYSNVRRSHINIYGKFCGDETKAVAPAGRCPSPKRLRLATICSGCCLLLQSSPSHQQMFVSLVLFKLFYIKVKRPLIQTPIVYVLTVIIVGRLYSLHCHTNKLSKT